MISLFVQPIGMFHSDLNMQNLEGRPLIGRKLLMVTDVSTDCDMFAVIDELLYNKDWRLTVW